MGTLTVVSGVSGSGKSTLINGTLYPILNNHYFKGVMEILPYKRIKGLEYCDKVIDVNQSPIGRTPRSNPATYTGVFSEIRNLFSKTTEAVIRGYKPGRFSFNVKGGRCETCMGGGLRVIEMNFLPDVYVNCEQCNGKRFNRETLEIRYKGKTISDVLEMTINEAVAFFEAIPKIYRKLKTIQDVGLGYITLGQQSTTLSGGEAQRVKLATELSKRDTGNTFYILDEPTTGLHFEDIRILMEVIHKLVDRGNTVLIIEHNLDVIKLADYIIDIGPEGGKKGGTIVAQGTPEQLIKSNRATLHYLKKYDKHLMKYTALSHKSRSILFRGFTFVLFTCSSWSFAQHTSNFTKVNARIILNANSDLVEVSQTNEWTNSSSEALSELYFYDWNNAYSSKTSKLAEEFISDFKKAFHLSSDERKGFTQINFIVVGKDTLLPEYTEADIFKLKLVEPIKSGERLKIVLNYRLKLPDSKFTNYGYDSNYIKLTNFLLLNCELNTEHNNFATYANHNLNDQYNPSAHMT